MSQPKYIPVDGFAGYAPGFPGVAQMVADLDDLFVGAPSRRPRRQRRPSSFRSLISAVRRLITYRRLAASGIAAIIMAVAA
jgi:hypothetical protein